MSATIKAMRAAGISDTQIVDTVLAMTEETMAKGRSRQAKFRNKNKKTNVSNVNNTDNVTGVNNVTSVNNVTQKENPPTPPKEKQTKSQKENPLSRGQKKKGCRLKSDWSLEAEDRAYAASKGLTSAETNREAEKFRNYWHSKAGAGATKLDWRKTWQNWCITAAEHKPTAIRNTTGPPETKQSRRAAAMAQTKMDLADGK